MAKSVEDRGRGARRARRDEGAYCLYVTEEERSPPGCIGREIDRLDHSRALSNRSTSTSVRGGRSEPSIAARAPAAFPCRSGNFELEKRAREHRHSRPSNPARS